MNIENLQPGMIIKNYKQLCEILGIRVTSGQARQNQLDKLSEYVKYEHKKQKYIIIEIITNQSTNIDTYQRQTYMRLIELLIIAKLIGEEDGYGVYTYHQLMNSLYMVNPTFNNVYKKGNYQFINDNIIPVDYKTYVDFRNNAYPLIKQKIKYTLESMKKRQLIDYKEEQYVCVIDENGNRVFREPTVNEILVTLKIGQELLRKYNCFDLVEVDEKKMRLKFEQEKNNRQNKELGWEFSFEKIVIYKYFAFPNYTLDQTKKILYTEAKQENLTVKENELNSAIAKMINRVGTKNHLKAEERLKALCEDEWKYNKMSPPKNLQYLEHRASKKYIKEWKALTNYFICSNGNVELDDIEESQSYIEDNIDIGI